MRRRVRLRDPSAPKTWNEVHTLGDAWHKVRADYLAFVHGLGWSEEEFVERAALATLFTLALTVAIA